MKLCLAIVLAFIAIASASRLPLRKEYNGKLPLPEAIAAKWPHLLEEDVNQKIVGGTEAADGDAPHQVMMLRSGSFMCGGSAIGRKWVLTAAHCCDGYENNAGVITIKAGSNSFSDGSIYNVLKVNKHASYNSRTIDYDICILELVIEFILGVNIRIINLEPKEWRETSGDMATVTGWGRLTGGGALPNKLMKVDMPLLSKSQCNAQWGSVNTITDRMVCSYTAGKSACNGDSGGPLINQKTGNQCGVVSWGSSTCSGMPSVYAHVADHRDWIDKQIS